MFVQQRLIYEPKYGFDILVSSQVRGLASTCHQNMVADEEGESAANGCWVAFENRAEISVAAVAVKFHPLRKLFVATMWF
jgi:hypothetical protein